MSRKAVLDTESAVWRRYERAAKEKAAALCCPVRYDPKYLDVIPAEILERDYGCGDPTPHVRPGDTVLDLGSGGGKLAYVAAQMVGPKGGVIGVDFSPAMLALARKHQSRVAERVGYDNVDFRRGRIQDLALSLDEVDAYLEANPIRSSDDLHKLEEFQERLRRAAPLVADGSVDVIISNCVLNLVKESGRENLFREMYRVLKRGGRVAISDVVSDEDVPKEMKGDPELWSGCIAGAHREDGFLEAFEQAGFYGIAFHQYEHRPWQTVRGIEFRSVTVTARKGKEGPCRERYQAVIYKGPWKKVEDDDGHILYRGKRMAVCDKTYHLLTAEPYAEEIIPVPPLKDLPLEKAKPFACGKSSLRPPWETKGKSYRKTTRADAACGPGCC